MKIILLIHGVFEIIAGIVIILNPGLLLWDVPMDTLAYNLSKMYGIGALIIGTFSYQIYRYAENEKLLRFSSLTAIGYHLFLSFHLYGLYQKTIFSHPGILGVHILMFFLLFILYLKKM